MSCDTICVSIRLHIFPIAHFMLECFSFLFCSFFPPIFVVVLFHFSMCHALRFRSRCINTQFNREFERHLFTYLWFRLKIWKCKFHTYKLEAQSSFFIFRQWVYLFIAYVQIVFHVWSKFQIYTSMVYVGLVGWVVVCMRLCACMHIAHLNEGGLFSQQIPGYLLAPFFLHAHNVALQNSCVCGPWWQLNLISRTINICLLCNWHSFTFGPKCNRNSMDAFSCAP